MRRFFADPAPRGIGPLRGALLATALWTLAASMTAAERPCPGPRLDGVSHGAAPVGGSSLRLGTNLRELADWSTQRPFIDLFKQARAWLTQCDDKRDQDCAGRWDTGEHSRLDLDPNGWVRSLPDPADPGYSIAATVLDVPDGFPGGRYLLLYEGTGTLRYGLGARRIDAESGPGRDLLDIDVRRGPIHIQILATDPGGCGDYLRGLRLIREDHEPLLDTQIFNPEFLARTRPFQALRFMEWSKTNGSESTLWKQRSRAADAMYTGPGGVPAEVMIDLANRLGKPPWLNIPHRAGNDYVRRFADLVRKRLRPELPVFIEYSNEVWNRAFSQRHWVREQAETLWPEGPHSEFTKVINWYGKRSAEVCTLWKTVFAARPGRVICVIGAQAANGWTASEALACPLWSAGAPCRDHGIDAIGIAPYFGIYLGDPEYREELARWSAAGSAGLDRLFEELAIGGLLSGAPRRGALAETREWIERHAAVSAHNGLALIGYEGGQHLVRQWPDAHDDPVSRLLVAANRDPRMGQLYADYLQGWKGLGGGLLMHFSDIAAAGPYGSWGALEHVLQTESPKYLALLDYLGNQRGGKESPHCAAR